MPNLTDISGPLLVTVGPIDCLPCVENGSSFLVCEQCSRLLQLRFDLSVLTHQPAMLLLERRKLCLGLAARCRHEGGQL